MIHGRSWRGGPGERELRDLSPAEGTTRPDFFGVAYTSRQTVSLRLVYADGSPCGGRHARTGVFTGSRTYHACGLDRPYPVSAQCSECGGCVVRSCAEKRSQVPLSTSCALSSVFRRYRRNRRITDIAEHRVRPARLLSLARPALSRAPCSLSPVARACSRLRARGVPCAVRARSARPAQMSRAHCRRQP